MKIQTKFCPVCKKAETYDVDPREFKAWKRGVLIQTAFPNLSEDQLRRLTTGLHGECANGNIGREAD